MKNSFVANSGMELYIFLCSVVYAFWKLNWSNPALACGMPQNSMGHFFLKKKPIETGERIRLEFFEHEYTVNASDVWKELRHHKTVEGDKFVIDYDLG